MFTHNIFEAMDYHDYNENVTTSHERRNMEAITKTSTSTQLRSQHQTHSSSLPIKALFFTPCNAPHTYTHT